MDEEGKKINLGSFFERSDSIDKVASSALSKSNSAMNAVGANKLLIESLQTSIETMQTQIRDIANYIIIDRKFERDQREDKLLEEQDAKQKQEMTDKALGLQGLKGDKGSKGSKGQPGEFGQEGGGGSFLGGLIKALALGGTLIASVKLLGPVLLPMLTKGIFTKLIPALGKGLSLGFGKLGGVIAKGLTGSLGKLPIVGKAIVGLGSKLIGGIGSVAKTILGSIVGAIGLSGLAGGSVKASESNMSLASGEDGGSDEGLVESDTFTVKSNATLEKGEVVSGNMSQADAERNIKKLELESQENDAIQAFGFHSPEHNEVKKKIMILDGVPEEAIYTDEKGKLRTKGYSTYGGETTVSDDTKKKKKENKLMNFVQGGGIIGALGRMLGGETTVSDDTKKKTRSMSSRLFGGIDALSGNLLDLDKKGGETFGGGRVLGGVLDAVTGNLLDLDKKGGETFGGGRVLGGVLDAITGNRFDFDRKNESIQSDDLTLKDVNQLKSSVSTNSAAIQTITSPSSQNVMNTNSPVTVQKSKPQVSYTEIKTTKPAIPFINTLGNQYLSLSPHTNKLPPEIARMIQ